MAVLGSAEQLASWVGFCPGNNESAGKRKSGRIRRSNFWVRRRLYEIAQVAAITRCALKAKFEALAIRQGHKKSIVALARNKMQRALYAMVSSGSRYQDKTVDYEALGMARNAPRWMNSRSWPSKTILGATSWLSPTDGWLLAALPLRSCSAHAERR